MRHQRKRHRLGRDAAHRKATLAALSSALIRHKRITTTQSKAKALRVFVEPLINRARNDTTHNRRQVFRHLQDKHAVSELFGEIAEKIADRPGGYTRVVKLGQRHGDSAPMAMIELVDYNDVQPEGAGGRRKKTRRGRSRRSKAADKVASAAAAVADAAEDVVEAAGDVVEDVAEAVSDVAEDVVDAVSDAAEEAADEIREAAAKVTKKVKGDDDVAAADEVAGGGDAEEAAGPEDTSAGDVSETGEEKA